MNETEKLQEELNIIAEKLDNAKGILNCCVRYTEWCAESETLEDFMFYFEILEKYWTRLIGEEKELIPTIVEEGMVEADLYKVCVKWGLIK